MYTRIIHPPKKKSFFLFGPRGTGKTTWLKSYFPNAVYIDLLESTLFTDLLAQPQRLGNYVPENFQDWIIIDEVQRVPALLHEIHRLIESKGWKFVITGSSARKLKSKGINLLAGRALTYHMYPLTVSELGKDFSLSRGLHFGHLPATFNEPDPKRYLESYVATYLREEVQQEGLTRNLAAFSRFLEAASFSQGGLINISEISRECSVNRKVVENYFGILQDLMIGEFLPVFTRKAKRRMISHPKFYFFDVGVYRTIRPKGPLDIPEEIEGAALETLMYQEMKAINDYLDLGWKIFYWRTSEQLEVDFVLYGERGIRAFEIKRKKKISLKDMRGMHAFLKSFPSAKTYMLFGGNRPERAGNINILPFEYFFKNITHYLS